MAAKILEDKQDRTLSTKEAAEATDFHQTHINKLLVEGKLKGTKGPTGRWAIKQSDLDKYMATNEPKPRRSKKVTQLEAEHKPPKTLFTQLDEKHKEVESLNEQLKQSQAALKLEREQTNQQIEGLEAELEQAESLNEKQELKIKQLEERNTSLEDQIYEHNQYIKDVLKEVLNSIMGSSK